METGTTGFHVDLENFSGPFDLLLGLIAKRKLDITEVALAEVTDEFLAYVAGLRGRENLEELSQFLLVASTLLDLKTARLLPGGEVEDELDLDLLEARDLLFARLLQYRAYKAVSQVLRAAFESAGAKVPRRIGPPEEFRGLLPPLRMTAGPEVLAEMMAAVLQRDHMPPTVSTEHLHLPQVSVPEQRAIVLTHLQEHGRTEFTELVADAESTLIVIGRFLALLELFSARLCTLDQSSPLGELWVEATEKEAA